MVLFILVTFHMKFLKFQKDLLLSIPSQNNLFTHYIHIRKLNTLLFLPAKNSLSYDCQYVFLMENGTPPYFIICE